jgi:hypothetical protein
MFLSKRKAMDDLVDFSPETVDANIARHYDSYYTFPVLS